MTQSKRASIYDRLRPHLDAADLIRRLGLKESRTIGSEAYLNPLCHQSSSGESLQVNLHTGRWNCKSCQSAGVSGDLFQLVEYVLTNGAAPSRGNAQGSSEGHRQAITWLCDQFGIPFDDNRIHGDEGLDVVHLFAMAAHQHLLTTPAALEWIQEKWGFDLATVEAYGIGLMPSPILPAIAAEAARSQSRGAFRSSGLGWYTPEGVWRTRFEGRVLFPYLEHGRAVYLIGRATPWTPAVDNAGRRAKYHKLSVHSEQRPYISERVTNDHLYNEPVMATADEIGVVEGVADAVAISSLGVAVVSPVTISFNATDLERFVRKCHENGIKRVWILFDNELSGSGNWAARRTGLKLVEGGLAVKILTLPLGDEQQAARDEVTKALGAELFDELERSDPRERKALLVQSFPDTEKLKWIVSQVEASKIDAAEWSAQVGAGAPGRFDAIHKAGRDVIFLEIEDVARGINHEDDAVVRAGLFARVIELAAHVEERLSRESYAGEIAKAAGKGVSKQEVARRVAAARRELVKPKRAEEKRKAAADPVLIQQSLVLLPPDAVHTQPKAPAPKPSNPNAPAAPAPPGEKEQTEHERYAPGRDSVAKAVEGKCSEEIIGEHVAQILTRSMGHTAFRTPDALYLVRGSNRVEVGTASATPRFVSLLYLASGLTPSKSSHRAYIAAAIYFLERDAQRAEDVAWSYVSKEGAVFFPTGDIIGSILKIEPGAVSKTRMAEVRVPAVAGHDFEAFAYTDSDGGIARILEVFRWTSISVSDRMVLVYWIVCLPMLRRIGTVPIVRIEGGSSSGKTRTVDAVSYLVNGRKSSSVPTAAALVSRMSTEMLTIDDNREAGDISPAFLGTLLQATHLGAREKRKGNSDTGTVVERICGALLMNGVEPIHDGRSEIASRMLTLRSSESCRAPDSPTAEAALIDAILYARDDFWSESARRCAAALELDKDHGERIGLEIEEIFGSTKIGRLSAYLRVMYLAWVVGQDMRQQAFALDAVTDAWRDAFASIGGVALNSLLAEELSVTAVRYVFAYGDSIATPLHTGSEHCQALDGKFNVDRIKGDAYLGPLRATQLARFARAAGKELNAPRAITNDLRAGQLERRLLDGLDFLKAAGFVVEVETTTKGRHRFTFQRQDMRISTPSSTPGDGTGDSWMGPGRD